MLKLYGYSERGVLNSLFYEIGYSSKSLDLINGLLNLAVFHDKKSDFKFENDAMILIEQSLSDFGDPDAVLLVNNNGRKELVFIEAKVKTCQKRRWSIKDEFNEFKKAEQEEVGTSNLFIQICLKQQFVRRLKTKNGGIKYLQNNGVKMPFKDKKITRKLGNNQVVIRAAESMKEYSESDCHIAIVPASKDEIESLFKNELKNHPSSGPVQLNIGNMGFISWYQIEKYCVENNLKNTKIIFEYNEGQIV